MPASDAPSRPSGALMLLLAAMLAIEGQLALDASPRDGLELTRCSQTEFVP